jgi:hypothetical protein
MQSSIIASAEKQPPQPRNAFPMIQVNPKVNDAGDVNQSSRKQRTPSIQPPLHRQVGMNNNYNDKGEDEARLDLLSCRQS